MKRILILIILSACCDYGDVRKAYVNGNANAKIILEAGFNRQSGHVDEFFLERALQGDDESMKIVLAQLQYEHRKTIHHPVLIPMQGGNK